MTERLLSITLAAVVAGSVLTGRLAARPLEGRELVPSPAASIDVATILMHEDRREVDPTLLGYLRHETPALRARAALAVGRIGRVEDVIVLAPLLADVDPDVRRTAAFSLGEIADSTAAAPLGAHILDGGESDASVRALAVEALGKLSRGGEACAAALADPAPEVRAAALLAAWRMPVEGALDAAIDALGDPDPELRWPAAYALMRLLGAPPSGRTPIPTAGELTDDDRTHGRDALLAAMEDTDVRVRLQATRGLRTFEGDVVTSALRRALTDADPRVRIEAVRALAASVRAPDGTTARRELPLEVLDTAFDDANPNVRVVAIEALATLGEPEAAEARLVARLDDDLPRAREVAFGALLTRWGATPPAPSIVDAHCERILASGHWSLRAMLADCASLLPEDRDVPLLRRLVADADGRVAKLAVEPLLTRLAERGTGSLWSRLAPEIDTLMAVSDPMVRLMTLATLAERFEGDSLGAATKADWTAFETLCERTYAAAVAGETDIDIRQVIVGAAASFPDRPVMMRLLESGCFDPAYVVRRDAVRAIEERGETPPRTAEPVETGRDRAAYRAILEWAARPHWGVIETDAGRIVVRLFSVDAPLTCWNFATLAGEGFYDDGAWHRVVPDFVLQDGCPRGDGWGGPEWQIRCEINRHRYVRGALGMALSGKDTGGSQFFVTHSAQPHLDGGYTVFGEVVQGMPAADRVTQTDRIRSIRVVDEAPVGIGAGERR